MNIKADLGRKAENCTNGKILLPFDDAVEAAIETARLPTRSERIELIHAAGRVLASDIPAPATLPRFDHSAMDGYAIRISDLVGNGPWTLRVEKTMAAGDEDAKWAGSPGTAVEIYTGASIPHGFDAVIIREGCSRSGHEITFSRAPGRGQNIRRTGEDIAYGSCAAMAGTIVTPHLAALLSALGVSRVAVRPPLRVGFLSTGSELRMPGEDLRPGQIYDSNRYMAAAMLALPWIEFTDLGQLPDDFQIIARRLAEASSAHDAVIASGGMSEGGADFMHRALIANGGHLNVMNVAMRPGKPAAIGRVGSALFIGLPGNPMAAAIVLHQIGLPALRASTGMQGHRPKWYPAIAGFGVTKRENRTEFMPVKLTGRNDLGLPVLAPLGRGSSGNLSSMARADGLVLLPPEAMSVTEGTPVRYFPFE